MNLAEFGALNTRDSLAGDGLTLRVGRFAARIRSAVSFLGDDIFTLYGGAEVLTKGYFDFDIQLLKGTTIHRFYHPQVIFCFNGLQPFAPLPADQAVPLMEWGMNWCVSNHYHKALIIHAAVVEKKGKAVVLPGRPGSGKSTLCSAMITMGGYRLLSDELTLIDPESGNIWPNPRPVSLKNQSIELVKQFFPEGKYSRTVSDTIKGKVCLMAAPQSSIDGACQPAQPGLVVFPRYDTNLESYELSEMSNGQAFLELANQSFNYSVLGKKGFGALGKHLDSANSYIFKYGGDVREAIQVIDELINA